MPSTHHDGGAAGRASAPTPRLDYDLLIVGAGPAGASTALHLARRAPALVARTLILEKGTHPRPKLCAGGLVPDVERCLEKLDLDVGQVRSIKVNDFVLEFEGHTARMRFHDDYAFRLVRRDDFDGWLSDRARQRGFAIEQDTHVRKVDVHEGHVEVHTDKGTLRARAVVGADGSNSVVRHAVAPRTHQAIGRSLEVLTPNAAPLFPTSACGPMDAYIEFRCIPGGNAGYTYTFPAIDRDGPARHWGVWDSRVLDGAGHHPLRPLLEDLMSRHGFELHDHKLEGFPVRWYRPGIALSAPRVLLAGDAAGVCTFFAEGISIAIGYGQIAAESIARGFETGDLGFADYGPKFAKTPLGRALTRRWLLAHALYRVRSRAAHRLLWRHGGPAIEAIVKRYVFNWSR